MFVKISNFQDSYLRSDWKGLDISKNIMGSQIYFGNEVAVETTQDQIPQHPDLAQITEQEYLAFKQAKNEADQADVVTLQSLKDENQMLGSQLFAMQTELLMKGVLD